MSVARLTSLIAIVLTFLSFHFLYSDGWLFDGTWSFWRQCREKLWPSDPDNRTEGWWKAPYGWLCALLAAVFGVWSVFASTGGCNCR